jgi:SAM-dependent methyltransferase
MTMKRGLYQTGRTVARKLRRGGGQDHLDPPAKLKAKHGGEDFHTIGRRWVETFGLWADLDPSDVVLDVGCGPGRMAIALGPHLGSTGRYEGFDVRAENIKWCKREIEPHWPQAHFQCVDVRNGSYNPAGTIDAKEFRFPYQDGRFTFAFLTSVFTHMLPEDTVHYLSEVSRVLAPGGRCLITYFLLNERVRAEISTGTARFTFPHEVSQSCFVQESADPESTVAYEETYIRRLYDEAGLQISEPVHFGSWSGAYADPPPRHSQDTIIARKPS